MRAGEPDLDLLRQLFTELEFTSLLKELLPEVQVTETHYSEAQSAADVENILNSIAQESALPSRWNKQNQFSKTKKKSSKKNRSQECWRSPTTHRQRPHPTRRPPRRHLRGRRLRRHSQTIPAAQPTSCAPSDHRDDAQINSRLQSRHSRARSPGHPRCKASSTIPCSTPTCSIPPIPRIASPMSRSAASISNLVATWPKPPTSPAGWRPLCAKTSSRQD